MASVGRLVKETMVQELSAEVAARRNVFVTTIAKLPAAEADALRKQLFASRASLHLIQRRLSGRVLSTLQLGGLEGLLDGSVGLVLSGEDAVPVAKLITEFQKAHEDWILVRGAVIEGQLLDQKRVAQLAAIPPKPVLLAQLVGAIESPMADVIFTIERLIGDIASGIEQLAAKKPAAAAPAQGAALKDSAPAIPEEKPEAQG
jgi:large subunit ribosomal protein L10